MADPPGSAARNVVLVHGGFVDDSGCEPVYKAYVSPPAAVAGLIAKASKGTKAMAHSR
jgi:hypothetical protein